MTFTKQATSKEREEKMHFVRFYENLSGSLSFSVYIFVSNLNLCVRVIIIDSDVYEEIDILKTHKSFLRQQKGNVFKPHLIDGSNGFSTHEEQH